MIADSPAGQRTRSLQELTNRQNRGVTELPGTVPEKEFVIWFTARSGSTWLGSLLFSAGFPKPVEYFHPNKIIRIASYLGVNSWSDYIGSIKRKRTRSGLFGHEMTFQFWDTLKNDGDAMRYLDFSGPSVVLFREDIVLQAISIYLAVTTGKWHRYKGVEQVSSIAQTAYDEDRIRTYIEHINKLEHGLKENRQLLISNAKYLSYEQLSRSRTSTVVGAFERHIGFRSRKSKDARSFHSRMCSEINLEMRERFLLKNRNWVSDIQNRRNWLVDSLTRLPLIDSTDPDSRAQHSNAI